MKKLYTFIITISITTLGFAQTDLYVSNNANSYIYVDGTAFDDTPVDALNSSTNAPLFVTNNIELAGPNSFIYLRNEGQLIQSLSSTGNFGTGDLSVYQEGNVSATEYNYWCSPIGDKTTGNPFGVSLLNDRVSVTGSVPAIVSHNADYNGTSSPLDIEERWIWKYTNPSNQYSDWVAVVATNTINPGEGFTMKGTSGTSANNPGNAQRYDFRGRPNTGTFSLNVAAPIGPDAQQTLAGNPYPSALDARAYLFDTQNLSAITTALYYWEQAAIGSHYIAAYQGGYGTYTINMAGTVDSYTPAVFLGYDSAGNSTGPVGGSISKSARRYIPVGQGFMVEGRTSSSGTVRVTNNMRAFYKETSANSEFFRDSENDSDNSSANEIAYNEYGFSIIPSDYKRFRINVEFNNLYKRQLLQNFHASATEGFDVGLEAKSPEGLDSDAYWPLDNDIYVIQAHNYDVNLRIPIVIKLTEQQPVSFSIFDIQNFDVSQPIFIHDIEADLYIDLRTQNYEINLLAGDYTNRFEITFQSETLSVTEISSEGFEVFQNIKNEELTLLNPNGWTIDSVSLFDVTGKRVLNANNVGNQANYRFTTRSLSEGVYVATIAVDGKQDISKKVIIKN